MISTLFLFKHAKKQKTEQGFLCLFKNIWNFKLQKKYFFFTKLVTIFKQIFLSENFEVSYRFNT